MRRSVPAFAAVSCALLLSACGNTLYGPPRLLQAGRIDDGTVAGTRDCPATPPTDRRTSPIDFIEDFYDRACASLRNPGDPAFARRMIDAGATLNRMRCADFFAQRAGNQTGERIFRGAIAPVSALITGILGIVNFNTDAGRREAIQILGIGESATIAGLELYESEFLFGAANINSVRILTMRALDEHAAGILTGESGFYAAARHLIDHQLICTPASILDLAQTAIRQGRVASAQPIGGGSRALGGEGDRTIITTLASNLRVTDLTADQLGSLWWLSDLVRRGGTPSQDVLAVLHSRLAGLGINPILQANSTFSIDASLVRPFTPLIDELSPAVTSGFEVTRRLLEAKISEREPAAVLDRTTDIRFQVPSHIMPASSRAVEVGVVPATQPTQ